MHCPVIHGENISFLRYAAHEGRMSAMWPALHVYIWIYLDLWHTTWEAEQLHLLLRLPPRRSSVRIPHFESEHCETGSGKLGIRATRKRYSICKSAHISNWMRNQICKHPAFRPFPGVTGGPLGKAVHQGGMSQSVHCHTGMVHPHMCPISCISGTVMAILVLH